MSGFEAWIGDCHSRNAEGEELVCQAAVWADGYDCFRAPLAKHLASLGLEILWLEEVLPAGQYLARYSAQRRQIGALAQAVHPRHRVELGPMRPLAGDGSAAELENWLTIEEIEGVEPLDAQFGVHPPKTVPDALQAPLFGQPEPTEAEIALYGSAEAVPPMKTYAILDAGKMQWGYREIEDCGMPHRCLFKGNAAEDLKDAAPYLIELDPKNSFTHRLFKYVPEMPDVMTSVHLWHKEPGIYIRTRAGFDAVWKHLRKFPRVQDERGKWYFFRFWEPRVLRDYLYDLRYETGKIMNWFGRRAAALTLIAISGGVMHSYALAENIPSDQKPEPIRLEQATHARQHARRVMAEFAEEQGIPFDWETYAAYDYPWQDYETEDLKIIVLLHGHFGVKERYPTAGMYPEGMQHEAVRRDLLGRLIFFKAQGVPYGL